MGKDDDIFYDNHYNFADFPWVCEIIFIILHLEKLNNIIKHDNDEKFSYHGNNRTRKKGNTLH